MKKDDFKDDFLDPIGTGKKLIMAATALLDAGGESAVTLRAVGNAVGVSHNAPYKHFQDRSALLAAVAIEDFAWLTSIFTDISQSSSAPLDKLRQALAEVADYGHKHPSRYRLLFSNPDIAVQGGALEKAAMQSFAAFAGIVAECQSLHHLPEMPDAALTSLLFATIHGLIDLEASGRLRSEKGFTSVDASIEMLINLLSQGESTQGESTQGESKSV